MKPVAIIGAGITGLTAAFYLKRRNVPVTVYEASPRVGGVIQSLRQDGYLAEFGPNTILETSPKISQLVHDAGLDLRRLDPEFLDHAIDALVGGIYAGDPQKLSVQQAFPKLADLEAKYGSLIKGQILGARERKRRGEVAKDRAPKFSFDEGLQVLPETLRANLGDSVRLNTGVTRLTQTPDGWSLDIRENGRETRVEHTAVIYAGTAFKLAELQIETLSAESETSPSPPMEERAGERRPESLRLNRFREIRYPPVASLVLGF